MYNREVCVWQAEGVSGGGTPLQFRRETLIRRDCKGRVIGVIGLRKLEVAIFLLFLFIVEFLCSPMHSLYSANQGSPTDDEDNSIFDGDTITGPLPRRTSRRSTQAPISGSASANGRTTTSMTKKPQSSRSNANQHQSRFGLRHEEPTASNVYTELHEAAANYGRLLDLPFRIQTG